MILEIQKRKAAWAEPSTGSLGIWQREVAKAKGNASRMLFKWLDIRKR